MTKATKTNPPTKKDMEKAGMELQKRAQTQGMDACHLCFRKYRDYEHCYHGVTRLKGLAVAVCAECAADLRYGFGFGLYAPTNADGSPTDREAYMAAFYSHPWNKAGKVSGTH